MNDTTNTSPADAPAAPAPLTADTRGSTFEVKSWEIDPADQALADQIQNFDPVWDTKGPTTVSGSVRLPSSIKATGLPPHLRDPIMAQLATVSADRRDAEEQRLVNAALYENSLGLRIAGGPGEGANAYQKAKFGLTFDIEVAEREFLRLSNELAEVERWDNVFDESTGAAKHVAVEKVRGQRREAMLAQQSLISRKLDQLNGLEGERRMAKALYEAVANHKALQGQLDERREGRELGEKLARDERVRRIAEARASTLRQSA